MSRTCPGKIVLRRKARRYLLAMLELPFSRDYLTTSLLRSEKMVLSLPRGVWLLVGPLLVVHLSQAQNTTSCSGPMRSCIWPNKKWYFMPGKGLLLVVALLIINTCLNNKSTIYAYLWCELLLVLSSPTPLHKPRMITCHWFYKPWARWWRKSSRSWERPAKEEEETWEG
jgi:hypothetical protein